MKSVFLMGLGVAATCAFAAPALTQDSGVDPAELKQIMAQHPDWAVWLADPALAKLTLAGPKMPNSNWRADDIRRLSLLCGTGKTCAAASASAMPNAFDSHDLQMDRRSFHEWSVKDGILTTGARVYNFLHTGPVATRGLRQPPAQPNPPLVRNIMATAASCKGFEIRFWTARTRPIRRYGGGDLQPESATGECRPAPGVWQPRHCLPRPHFPAAR